MVLMEDATEAVPPIDGETGELVRIGDRFGQRLEWSGVRDALMRSMRVVERLVCAEGVQDVAFVVDQCPVEEFSAAGAHPPLHDRIHPWDADTAAHDRDSSVGEDRVKQRWVRAVTVTDEDSSGRAGVVQVHREVAGGLGDPGGGGVRGGAQDPDTTGGVLDDREDV